MENNGFYKVNGAEGRHDSLTRIGEKNYLLIYGFGKDGETGWNWRKNYDHQPTKAELKSDIDALINTEADGRILSGYEYGGETVWLSSENQFNYKAAYDLAVQTNGATLPVTVKTGDDEAPVYQTFDSVNALGEFYMGMLEHIQAAQRAAWKEKDGVDYEKLLADV